MEFHEYIESELFIIVPVLYVLGMMLKKSRIDDRFIPLILGIMGIALVSVYKLTVYTPNGAYSVLSLIFSGITQGLLCASASVYANNIAKQIKKGKSANGDEDTFTAD